MTLSCPTLSYLLGKPNSSEPSGDVGNYGSPGLEVRLHVVYVGGWSDKLLVATGVCWWF